MRRAVLLRRVVPLVAASALAVPLLAATTAGAAPARPTAAPAIAWAPCPGFAGFDCATYDVPLDYDRPSLGTVRLALNRRPADDQAHKIGSLFLNPGGPGGAGLGFARAASRVLFDDDIRAKFDIVGFDPRGVGESTPVSCFGSDEEFEAVLGPVPSVPLGTQEVRETLAAYKTYTAACGRNGGPLLAHMSTLNVAKDLDRLRAAVGDQKLTYAGYSYGTLLGATYANLFPGRVRAVLLDGMVDPAERTQRSLLNELNRAGGFETALRGFLEACDAAGTGCAFSEGNPKAKWAAIREKLRQGPATLSDGSTITISAVTDYIAGNLYDPTTFVDMAATLQVIYDELFAAPAATTATTATRSAGGLLAGHGGFHPLGEAYSYNSTDTLFAVNCLDKKLPRGQAGWPAIAVGFEAVHRTFGRYQAYSAAVCGTWPVVTNERYAGPWNRRTANTVLIVGTKYDPATPYLFAQRATKELGRARLLTHAGYGHTSILSSVCVDEKTNNYILTGAVPPAGTVCQPDALPFGTATAAPTAAEKAVLDAIRPSA